MKQPKTSDLKFDKAGTKLMRSKMAKAKNIKITINVDAASLAALKDLAAESGVPYQRLLNIILKEGLGRKSTIESRIEKIERDLRKMKKALAA
jgi:predicted DNA binding CopG/RHH family protein